MDFETWSHRHALAIISQDENLRRRYTEFTDAIFSISDQEIMNDFIRRREETASLKSITPSINHLLKERLIAIDGWRDEVDIFNDTTGEIGNTEWRLDFACDNAFCVEVAFNHGEAIAWNLLKPVLSCELNHVQKAIQGQIGIYVCATDALKDFGNIDGASGSYEKVLRYLQPMMNQLTVPMVIIGLKPFSSFKICKNTRNIITNQLTNIQDFIDREVVITKSGTYEKIKGTLLSIEPRSELLPDISVVQLTKGNRRITLDENEIFFLEVI